MNVNVNPDQALELARDLFPEQIWLPLPSEIPSSKEHFTYPVAQSWATLNQIALDTFGQWFKETQPLTQTFTTEEHLWYFINGTCLVFEGTRLVLIPSLLDADEITIQREWVDIPKLAGHYFVAVNIDFEQEMVGFRGWISHAKVRETPCHPYMNSYVLELDDLAEDISLLWYILENCPVPTLSITPIVEADARLCAKFLKELAQPTLSSPRARVDMPFAVWSELLTTPSCRRQLVESYAGKRHIHKLQEMISRAKQGLSQVLDRLQEDSRPPLTLVSGLRSSQLPAGLESTWDELQKHKQASDLHQVADTLNKMELEDATKFLANKLCPSPGLRSLGADSVLALGALLDDPTRAEHIRFLIAHTLLRHNPQAEKPRHVLQQLIEHTQDQEILWQAVDALGDRSGAVYEQLDNREMRLGGNPLRLVIGLVERAPQIYVRIQVKPAQGEPYIRPGTTLKILDILGDSVYYSGTKKALSETVIQPTTSCIQFKFCPNRGQSYIIETVLGDDSLYHYLEA